MKYHRIILLVLSAWLLAACGGDTDRPAIVTEVAAEIFATETAAAPTTTASAPGTD